MTLRDRVKQLRTGAILVAGVSLGTSFLFVRCERAQELFSGASKSGSSWAESVAKGPVNDGCPRHDHATKRDLTIRFYREIPLSQFDGWIQIGRGGAPRHDVLYRGPYASTIKIPGVCYDGDQPGGDSVNLDVRLITKHHDYYFDDLGTIHIGSYSEVEVMFWVYFPEQSVASMTPIR